jgi:hypothetical protein
MMRRTTVCLAVLLLAGGVPAAGELKSGPQVGQGIQGGFRVQCANGLYSGKTCCPV